MGSGGKIMAGRGWLSVVGAKLWLVMGGRGWSYDLVMPVVLKLNFQKNKVNGKTPQCL